MLLETLEGKISKMQFCFAFLKTENKTALNFVKGLFNLQQEKRFMDFVNENQYLKEKNQLLNAKMIFSKCYDLGP